MWRRHVALSSQKRKIAFSPHCFETSKNMFFFGAGLAPLCKFASSGVPIFTSCVFTVETFSDWALWKTSLQPCFDKITFPVDVVASSQSTWYLTVATFSNSGPGLKGDLLFVSATLLYLWFPTLLKIYHIGLIHPKLFWQSMAKVLQ